MASPGWSFPVVVTLFPDDWRVDEEAHWGGIGGDGGWVISLTDFPSFSSKFSLSVVAPR
jgi:hypothetical protein